MTRSLGFARVGLSSARWLLPLITVLLISIILAYATSSALDKSASASTQAEVRSAAERASAEVSELPLGVTPADLQWAPAPTETGSLGGVTQPIAPFEVMSTTGRPTAPPQ